MSSDNAPSHHKPHNETDFCVIAILAAVVVMDMDVV